MKAFRLASVLMLSAALWACDSTPNSPDALDTVASVEQASAAPTEPSEPPPSNPPPSGETTTVTKTSGSETVIVTDNGGEVAVGTATSHAYSAAVTYKTTEYSGGGITVKWQRRAEYLNGYINTTNNCVTSGDPVVLYDRITNLDGNEDTETDQKSFNVTIQKGKCIKATYFSRVYAYNFFGEKVIRNTASQDRYVLVRSYPYSNAPTVSISHYPSNPTPGSTVELTATLSNGSYGNVDFYDWNINGENHQTTDRYTYIQYDGGTYVGLSVSFSDGTSTGTTTVINGGS